MISSLAFLSNSVLSLQDGVDGWLQQNPQWLCLFYVIQTKREWISYGLKYLLAHFLSVQVWDVITNRLSFQHCTWASGKFSASVKLQAFLQQKINNYLYTKYIYTHLNFNNKYLIDHFQHCRCPLTL